MLRKTEPCPDDKLDWGAGKRIVKDERLYSEKLDKALGYCKEAAEAVDMRSTLQTDNDGARAANTVIGIVGERGTGKTSFLYMLKDRLPKECLALDVVDPSNFQSGMSALELFLAQIYGYYTELNRKASSAPTVREPSAIHGLFRRISKSLSALRIDKSVYNADNPSIEVLTHMVDLLNVGKDLSTLCKEILAYANAVERGADYRYITMLIDDVDMVEGDSVYSLLEDVRKYLSGRIVVVIAYRDKQLKDSILSSKLDGCNVMHSSELAINNELQSRIEDFIEKVIPLDRTVRLLTQKDLLESKLIETLSVLGENDDVLAAALIDPYKKICGFDRNVTVKDWLDAVIYSKTFLHVMPVVKQEETVFVWPRNLRELISLVKVIQTELALIDLNELGDEQFGDCQKNLQRYRDYFVGRLYEVLDPRLSEVVDRWLGADYGFKNYVAYVELYSLVFPVDDSRSSMDVRVLGELLDADLIRPENVTLGDVSGMINKFVKMSRENESRIHLGYALKVLYSMEALGQLLEVLQRRTEGAALADTPAAQSYLSLINSCVIPPEANASSLSHEMLYLRDFDKWHNVLLEESGDEHLDARQSQVAMALLGCTPVACFQGTTLSERTLSQRATLYTSSRPTRQQSEKAVRYKEKLNRPIFTMNRVDPEKVEEGGDFPDASSPKRPRRYPVNITNVFGKEVYLSFALDRILGVSDGEADGAYLFYSMFDLDIIEAMRLEDEEQSKDAYRNNIRRINTALVFSKMAKLASEAAWSIFGNDRTLMRVEVPFERSLLARFHTPFVRNCGYRLFGDNNPPSILPFDSVVSFFEGANSARVSFRRVSPVSSKLRDLISRGGKHDIKRYAICLIQETAPVIGEELTDGLREIVARLEKPSTKPSDQERKDLSAIVTDYPYQANRAFMKYNNE